MVARSIVDISRAIRVKHRSSCVHDGMTTSFITLEPSVFITSHDVFIGGLSRLMYSYFIILSQLIRPLVEELLYENKALLPWLT